MADGWRYLAQRIDGSGQPGIWLDKNLPMSAVRLTEVLTGPAQLSGTIDPVFRNLLGKDGRPLLEEWGTLLHAEGGGQIRGSVIYQSGTFNGPQWSLTGGGFASYAKGMGYEGELATPFIDADPLDIVRHIWAHIQNGQDSNLGLQVDDATTTPVRVGTPATDNTGGGTNGPFTLNEWSNDDLGSDIDDLAKATPFDYHEVNTWNQAKTEVLHSLEFGYPSLGIRRKKPRFVLGENIQTVPTVSRDGANYASHVRFLGAGEGRDMVRAESRMSTGRLRRMATVDDKSVTAQEWAQRHAGRELAARQLLPTIGDVVCWDSPAARLGSWSVGDEIRVRGKVDWMPVDMWCRVLSITLNPDTPEIIGMSLMRSDMLT